MKLFKLSSDRKKYTLIIVLVLNLFILFRICCLIYGEYYSPIYTWEQNYKTITVNNKERVISRLIYGNEVWMEDPNTRRKKSPIRIPSGTNSRWIQYH